MFALSELVTMKNINSLVTTMRRYTDRRPATPATGERFNVTPTAPFVQSNIISQNNNNIPRAVPTACNALFTENNGAPPIVAI